MLNDAMVLGQRAPSVGTTYSEICQQFSAFIRDGGGDPFISFLLFSAIMQTLNRDPACYASVHLMPSEPMPRLA